MIEFFFLNHCKIILKDCIFLCVYLQGKEIIMYYINELLEEGVSERLPRWTELHPDAPATSDQITKLPLIRHKSSDSNCTLESEPLSLPHSLVNDTGSVEKLPDGAVGGCSQSGATLSVTGESTGGSGSNRSSTVESPVPQTSPIPRSRLASSTMEKGKSVQKSQGKTIHQGSLYFWILLVEVLNMI